jgi:hypothetical protein
MLPKQDVVAIGVLSASILGLALLAEGEAPSDFLRFQEGKPGEGKFETAIVSYAGKDGVTVDLIAAVHIADAAYYQELQERFATYDVLLYEMIKPRDAEPVPGRRPDNLLTAFQRFLKDILDLQFQLDSLDYKKPNFVHADLDPETFFKLQREKGENMLSLFLRLLSRQYELEAKGEGGKSFGLVELIMAFSSQDRASALKLLMARELEHMELLMAGFDDKDDGKESVLVGERNKVAMKGAKEAIEKGKKKLGIFYGGAHMPDFEKRLRQELGLAKNRVEWITAWDIKKKGVPKARGEAKRSKEIPAEKPAPAVEEPVEMPDGPSPRLRQF